MLGAVKSNSNPTLQTFEQLLKDNAHVFFPARTAKSLFAHWQLLKQYHLLPDQTVPPLNKNGQVRDFSEAEQQVRNGFVLYRRPITSSARTHVQLFTIQ